MACSNIMRLVSKAEDEGVTLAEVLARTQSPKDLDKMQAALAEELSSNYRTIQDFMSDVSVPSIEEILESDPEVLAGTPVAARSSSI